MIFTDSLMDSALWLALPIFLIVAAMYGSKPTKRSEQKPPKMTRGSKPVNGEQQHSSPKMVPVKSARETTPTPEVLPDAKPSETTQSTVDPSVFHPEMPRMNDPK